MCSTCGLSTLLVNIGHSLLILVLLCMAAFGIISLMLGIALIVAANVASIRVSFEAALSSYVSGCSEDACSEVFSAANLPILKHVGVAVLCVAAVFLLLTAIGYCGGRPGRFIVAFLLSTIAAVITLVLVGSVKPELLLPANKIFAGLGRHFYKTCPFFSDRPNLLTDLDTLPLSEWRHKATQRLSTLYQLGEDDALWTQKALACAPTAEDRFAELSGAANVATIGAVLASEYFLRCHLIGSAVCYGSKGDLQGQSGTVFLLNVFLDTARRFEDINDSNTTETGVCAQKTPEVTSWILSPSAETHPSKPHTDDSCGDAFFVKIDEFRQFAAQPGGFVIPIVLVAIAIVFLAAACQQTRKRKETSV